MWLFLAVFCFRSRALLNPNETAVKCSNQASDLQHDPIERLHELMNFHLTFHLEELQ